MQDSNEARVEGQSGDNNAPATTSKSSFNDAEYQRWNEKLRNRGRSKDK
jgi:hypothetical protein